MGKFTFVLVKLENRQGSSRLLVRGWQGCSQAALMQAVEKEVSACAALALLYLFSIWGSSDRCAVPCHSYD